MEWSLVRRWATAGKLPFLRQLMERGMRGELANTAAQLPDTAWPCVFTGMNPAKFGRYFYVQYDARTMGLQHLGEEAMGLPPVWERLSQAGQRVGVVDPPHFAGSRALNGVQVAHWGVHAIHAPRVSIPETLLGEIEARFGRHPVGECDAVDDTPGSLARLRRRILDGVRLHGEVIRTLIQASPWDTFVAGFSESHCAGHHFWRFMDSSHPRHPRTALHGLADTIERVYRAIDEEIAKIVDVVGPDVRCLVVSAHGMGPLYHASWNLQEILEVLGFGEPATGEAAGRPGWRRARRNPWRAVKMLLPGALQYRIKATLPRGLQHRLVENIYTGGRRWDACRAFAIPNNDTVGAIRINLQSRDRTGLVPAAEYAPLCKEITEALHELEDPATGRPVVKRVTFIRDEFQGPFIDRLPDLTVLWEQSFPWTSVHSPRFGTFELHRQDARTGSHTEHGFLLVTGPGIPAGQELEGASVYDITPTMLEAAAVDRPAGLDGRPLPIPTVM
jgi:predicted AlkP superfamily phosphohydrolase/phosphomutase